MKKRLITLLAACCLLAALSISASALEYTFDSPSTGDFGMPTSAGDTIREREDPNTDKSKNSALIPPGFGTPTSYLPNSGEFLTPNLAAGGPLNGGNLIPGTVGAATLPGAPGTDGGSTGTGYPTVNYPTASGPGTGFTELTPDLYNSDGSLGTLKIPSIGLTVKVYEGTGSAPLLKGAGHFTGTTAWDGNYCVAGHNRGVRNDFGKIHTLRTGDTISLTTSLGSRSYSVTSVSKISYTDTSMLEATSDNCITLFTCVEDQPAYRWCVRAVAG